MKYSKNIIHILAIMLIMAMVALVRSTRKVESLQKDLDRQTENVSGLSYSTQYGKVRDSLPVAQNIALQSKYDELEKLHLADIQIIKELKVKLKDVESIHTASSTTTDTVYLSPEPGKGDSVFSYDDKWVKLHIDIPTRICQYSTYDSLTTIVSRTYKHKFLWLRWGTKGYQVQIVNFNPHAKINYSRFIQVVK